jgi:hypothetical protein
MGPLNPWPGPGVLIDAEVAAPKGKRPGKGEGPPPALPAGGASGMAYMRETSLRVKLLAADPGVELGVPNDGTAPGMGAEAG